MTLTAYCTRTSCPSLHPSVHLFSDLTTLTASVLKMIYAHCGHHALALPPSAEYIHIHISHPPSASILTDSESCEVSSGQERASSKRFSLYVRRALALCLCKARQAFCRPSRCDPGPAVLPRASGSWVGICVRRSAIAKITTNFQIRNRAKKLQGGQKTEASPAHVCDRSMPLLISAYVQSVMITDKA